VVHDLLGGDSIFGRVVDVDQVLETPPLPHPTVEAGEEVPPIDVSRVLEAGRR
jgi:hypothetical protein